MFRKLKIRFILLASAAIVCILLTMIAVLNSVRFLQTNGEIQAVLNILSANNGDFPSVEETAESLQNDRITIDTIYQYRYFSVVYKEDKTLYSTNLDHLSNLSKEQALSYANKVIKNSRSSGVFKVGSQFYSYQITQDSKTKRYLLVVLDSTNYLESRNDFFWLSIQLCFYSFIFFVLVVSGFSNFAIRPYIKNYENQKRFITNAGHELKTPLAIISANTELQELMTGENEWTESTKDQVKRLSNLINQMVVLARLEEQPDVTLVDVNFSEVVKKVAGNFKSVIEKAGKKYEIKLQEDIHVKATEDELYELVSILIDNACKYCDEDGQIFVTLTKAKRGKRARLTVANSYADGKNVDYSRFFDRFYREDESHNQKQPGYGIGLSMAESLVRIFKGRIWVSYKKGLIGFTVLL
ncbi:sensor histidine kinase [Streptococcus sanguinis SK1 = NCTC 7863]|jgi:histidine kinase (sensor protein), putative|uniref:histidine kinase n=4 Tax=Streptococcus sanguinis TaxID=1305 RepID=F3U8T6_STRSA|nr:HAMP domain-containing sensor histidine kinase [Streptococcus sanguinis]EGC25571.1 ATPase/histidine kinase/DNA gyrase B/HSP90 domain protein [Streptococcus sanguinis SK405]EGC26949.1 ATPase/histidine kinase/DNA gyrase B/HSP90 domain protein [Streptococcus sanguinis SK678]EGF08341.1 sensor histidine kinase [Streptococcus sanguinis SK1057]EGF09242.1 sensor histidine kinase [Streptococcus sanguinis SK1 = NCTC 7863]EGF19930.1 sensor histidine kinase [Streptococcus sanguinis SK408]